MVDTTTTLSGLAYLMLPCLVLPFYILLTYVMITNTSVKRLASNRLVTQMNVADCIQLVLHSSSGIFVLFPRVAENNMNIVRTMGALINAAWLVTFPILCLLAITRILIIYQYASPLNTTGVMKTANIVAVLLGAVVLILGIVGRHFTFTDLRWEYDVEKPYADVVRSMELYVFSPCILLSYLVYLAITVRIRMTRTNSKSIIIKHHSSSRIEYQIFLHYFIVCTMIIALVLFWNLTAILKTESRLQDFITNCCWIICCWSNPIAVMLFNTNVRRAVLEFVGLRRPFSMGMMTKSPMQHQNHVSAIS